MKLSPNTITILKNFSQINQSLLIKPGNVLRTQTQLGNVHAQATLEDSFPQRFAIFDLSRFLGTLSLFSDPDIQFKDKYLTVEEGNTKTRFVYADELVVIKPPETDAKTAGVVCKFNLGMSDLASLQKAAGVMSFEDFSVQVANGKVSIVVHDSKNESSDEYRLDLGDTDFADTASWDVKIENLKVLPAQYSVEVHKTLKGKIVFRFHNEKLSYWVATTAQKA